MERVLAGLNWKICVNHIEDIIVFSKTLEEHLRNLQTVFDRLKSHNVKLNNNKCNFFKWILNFWGILLVKMELE